MTKLESKQFGAYRVVKSIGRGGFAKIYLGEHIYLGTKVAIKVLRVEPVATSEELEQFITEARIVAQLRHPHIISILDFNVQNEIPYLVMEYAPNGSLSTHYPAKPQMDFKVALRIIKQVASALQFAHEHNIVHCDIKPDNILLGENNRLLLSDFGIAVALHSNLKTQEAMGTMQYMAPEQFDGKPVPASDQYGLAVVAYRMLCGKLPFNGRNPAELYYAHTKVTPPSPRSINPDIPLAVEQVLLIALAKDPKHRFMTISAFAKAFEQAIVPKRPARSAGEKAVESPYRVEAPKTHAAPGPPALLPSLSSLLPSLTPVQKQAPADPVSPSAPRASADLHYDTQPLRPSQNAYSPSPASPAPEPIITASQPCHFTYSNHTGWVSTVAWSPNGKLLASGSWDNTVHVWDITGKTLFVYQEHQQPVKSVCWSPDGTYIASGSWDNTMRIWDATTGETLPGEYAHEAQIESVAWSPDGVYLASAGHDGVVHVWNVSKRRAIFTYRGYGGPIWSVAWSPDSKYIVIASHDKSAQVREVLTETPFLTFYNHRHPVTAAAWSRDGSTIATGDQKGTVYLWNASNGNTLHHYQDATGAIKALSWSPIDLRLASAVKHVQVWDMTGPSPDGPVYTYKGHQNWVNALAWSPDGQTIASASDDKTVQLWEVARSPNL